MEPSMRLSRISLGEEELARNEGYPDSKEESDLDDDYNSGMTEEEVRGKIYLYPELFFSKEYQLMLEFKGHSNIVNCHDFPLYQIGRARM